MKYVVGIALILAGIALGLYVGLWLMFIGGLIQIIDAVKATPTDKGDIAMGVLRMIFASLAGWVVAFVLTFAGYSIIVAEPKRRVSREQRRRGIR